MPKRKIGIEFGTRNLRICTSDKDDCLRIKSVIALNQDMDVVAFGGEAYAMMEKEPYDIHIVSPMLHGVIGDYTSMRILLHTILHSYCSGYKKYQYVIAVPVDISSIERRAFLDLMWEAGKQVKRVQVMQKPVLDAIGLGIKVEEPKGNMIVNFGADTTEISVISLGGIVSSRLLQMGGNQLDDWMINDLRHKHSIEVGRKTAQNFKIQYARSEELHRKVVLKGRDLVSGLPKRCTADFASVEVCIRRYVEEVCTEIKSVLEVIPPELASDILIDGIYISGGGCQFHDLKQWMEEVLQIEIHVEDVPQESVIRGLKAICDRYDR